MTILPYKTIGIIGGGQLGRMMAQAAKAMGYYVAVLEPEPGGPAAQVSDIEIVANYNDLAAIKKLAEVSDIITYEFENIDYEALTWLEKEAYLPQGSHVLKITQHRHREKSAIKNMGIPVPDFCLIETPQQLQQAVFYPSVLKTTFGGYDGKGQVVLKSPADLPRAMELAASTECILEQWMHYSKEVSVVVARSTTGEVATFPVAENIHVNNILHQSIVPARIPPQVEAKAIACAKKIAEELNVVGLLGVEMFVVGDDIYINELAPRPHNSGHYTMDACVTSQFQQHIRAICGLPLGDPSLHTPVVMVNILGDHMPPCGDSAQQMPASECKLEAYLPLLNQGKIHLYGKTEARTARKMGHVNVLGDINDSLAAIENCKIWRTENV
ncbi:MAG: 5-(carboxyamino)imidazole ribonucleotide synthase [Defluviitaleaceae bacterium]|nr:5-(carboxyamino)imidazole ribonucleotide synthase [Defluviitaleaceae bacterium]